MVLARGGARREAERAHRKMPGVGRVFKRADRRASGHRAPVPRPARGAVASIVLANRSRTLARVVLALAGLILLGSLIGTAHPGWQHRVSRFVPALLMLGAVPFMGRMPTPAEDHVG